LSATENEALGADFQTSGQFFFFLVETHGSEGEVVQVRTTAKEPSETAFTESVSIWRADAEGVVRTRIVLTSQKPLNGCTISRLGLC
jgi:hypothetical protein